MTIAIAVLTYNQPKLAFHMVEQLNGHVTIVDNGSPEPIRLIGVPTIRLSTNNYFAGGWNEAMEFFREYEWVAMLNDDLEGVSFSALSSIKDAAEDLGYSAISPAFNSPHNHMHPFGQGSVREVHAIDWVATIIKTSAWFEVGGFNAEFFPGYGSDLDISYRLKQKGHHLAVDDRHTIYHKGGVAAIEGGTQEVQGNVAAMDASFQKLYGVPGWAQFVEKYLR